jgi:hypothetical protein
VQSVRPAGEFDFCGGQVVRRDEMADSRDFGDTRGCPRAARWFGDDIVFKADMYDVNFAGLPMMAFMLRHLEAGEAPLHRARRGVAFVTGGRRTSAA